MVEAPAASQLPNTLDPVQLRAVGWQELQGEATGAQRGDVATIRALWAIQDRLALSPAEEKAIDLKREFVAGQERVVWAPALSVPPREFDLTDAEICRIRAAIETWSTYGVAVDRRWLEPLLRAIELSEPE